LENNTHSCYVAFLGEALLRMKYHYRCLGLRTMKRDSAENYGFQNEKYIVGGFLPTSYSGKRDSKKSWIDYESMNL